MQLPRLFLGTERLASVLGVGAKVDRTQAERILDRTVELGDIGLDLAVSYQLGGSERLVGSWLKRRRNRQQLFLLSKAGHPLPWASNRLTSKVLASELSGCLRRLRTDYLDLFLLHRDHPRADLEELADALSSFVRQGSIRSFGLSNWTAERVAALDGIAREKHGIGVAASSPQFSLPFWTFPLWPGCVSIGGPKERRQREFYEKAGIVVIAYSSLGRGLIGTGSTPPAFDHPENQKRRERAVELAVELGGSPVDVALAYLVSQPFSVCPVVSTYDLGHLESNLRALELRLTKEQISYLEGTGESPF